MFGFTGIFRRLARSTQLITQDGRLDDAGHRLVDVWSRERGLVDMLYGRTGPGPLLRDELRKAFRQGLSDAHTSYRPPAFCSIIAVHLGPARTGKRERSLLLELIHERVGTPEQLQCISGAIAARKSPLSFAEEADFLRALRKSAPTGVKRDSADQAALAKLLAERDDLAISAATTDELGRAMRTAAGCEVPRHWRPTGRQPRDVQASGSYVTERLRTT